MEWLSCPVYDIGNHLFVNMNTIYFPLFIVLVCVINWNYVLTQADYCETPNRKFGKCVSIYGCPVLLSLLQGGRPLPQNIIKFLRESSCGFDDYDPLVCCPTNVDVATTPFSPFTQTNIQRPVDVSVRDVTYHPRLGLLPNNCGDLGEDNKITKGDAPGLFEFRWMALLGFPSREGLNFRCGGSLINQRYVLTAGHCIAREKPVIVRLGEYDLRRDRDCEDSVCAPRVQDVTIEEFIVHREYSKTNVMNDIGLIRLSRDVVYNDAVSPICLPVGRAQQLRNLDNMKVTVTGWGATEEGRPSAILLKVDLPVVPLDKCAPLYGTMLRVNSRHICAGGTEGKDSCVGDSGGPLQTLASKDGRPVYVQYGIVAAGPHECGSAGQPGIYTKVGYYMEWILDKMRP